MNELQVATAPGSTLYAVLLDATGRAWNGSAFETLAGANWADYAVALTEAVAGIYLGALPAVALGQYSYVVYEQAGANPATTDVLRGMGSLAWDGSTVCLPVAPDASGLVALLDAIKAKTDGLPASPAAVGSAMTLTAAYDAAKTAAQAGDAMTLDAAALTAIGARVIEGTHTQDDVLRLVLALISKVDGAGTGTGKLTYRDSLDTKDRIVQTVDGSGNRSAVTLDGTL